MVETRESRRSMPILTYRLLDSPYSQISAAHEFCEAVEAYVHDSWPKEWGKKPDMHGVHVHNVLDSLACLGLRFESDGTDADEDHFFEFRRDVGGASPIGRVLWSLAEMAAKSIVESFEWSLKHHLDLVTGCLTYDGLVFVTDDSAVCSKAYYILLSPQKAALAWQKENAASEVKDG